MPSSACKKKKCHASDQSSRHRPAVGDARIFVSGRNPSRYCHDRRSPADQPHRRRAFFFFNDTQTTEIYTLSLHDALPISTASTTPAASRVAPLAKINLKCGPSRSRDRKSTRLNSCHLGISYAVFCLKKKKKKKKNKIIKKKKKKKKNKNKRKTKQ